MRPENRPRAFGAIAGTGDLRNLESVPSEGIYGLGVFAARFFRYLLRHSSFDEFHIFSAGLASQTEKTALLNADPRVRLRPLAEFRQALGEADFRALHNPWGPDIGPWIDLRNRLSERAIPVTGLTHTISYQSFLPRTLLTIVLGMKPWDSIICTASPAVVAMRNWVGHLKEQFGNRLSVEFEGRLDKIPLAVDTEIFCRRDKAQSRRRFNLPQDHVILLYLGRFSAYDKMDLVPLLLAFKIAARQEARPATLVMAGADSRYGYAGRVMEVAAKLGVADSIRILRNLDDADVPQLYSAADLFVSPSDNLQETFGQSVIEAMSSELPVVCSDWDGYRDLVEHEKTGYLIPTYWQKCDSRVCDYSALWEPAVTHFYLSQSVSVDVECMAAALRDLIASAELRSRMGAQGRRRALELYDWPVVIGRHVELWEELNRVASSHSYRPQPSSWFRPDFFSTFKHYASAAIEPATEVRATNNEDTVSWYEELNSWLRAELLAAIRERAKESVCVGELQAAVINATACSEEEFCFHLLWMLKYNELRRV